MSSRIEVVVTEQVRPTKKKTGVMQVCGIEVGSAFPIEAAVFIPNGTDLLKPGKYYTENLKKKGNEIIVDLFLSSLHPVKG